MLAGTNSFSTYHAQHSSCRRHHMTSLHLQMPHTAPSAVWCTLVVPIAQQLVSLGPDSSRCCVLAAAAKKAASSTASKGFGNPSKSSPSKAASRATQKCPCGSGKQYQSCCGHYHEGTLAPNPEALLRSRYSAYSLGLVDYLVATTHRDNPEHTGDPITYARSLKRVAQATEYISLRILDTPEQPADSSSSSRTPESSRSSSSSSSGSSEDDAYLKFAVEWRSKGESGPPNIATETSHFKRVAGAWLYYAALE